MLLNGRSGLGWTQACAGLGLALALAPGAGQATAQPAANVSDQVPDAGEWPRMIQTEAGTFTVYQPQVEAWDGLNLEAHAAVSVQKQESEAPVYGVGWIQARSMVDKTTRLVTLDEMRITKVRFPSAPDREATYQAALQKDVTPKVKVMALDRLATALEVTQTGQAARSLPLRNEPPRIVFSDTTAILVYVDGAPAYRPVKGTGLERVINTRPLLLKDSSGRHYLRVFDGWMLAAAAQGPYAVATKGTPKDLDAALKDAIASGQVDLLPGGDPKDPKTLPSLTKGPAPAIHVASSPTELIVTDGAPNLVPIEGTKLLYVKNTTGHVFKHMGDQKTYVLISGRWFRGPSEAGPWEFVANDALPKDFAAIPDESPKENVLAAVAGTPQAKEALISNSIPQTAEVKRSEAKLNPPRFDGDPKLEPIEGTSLLYVVNTATPIIRAGPAEYYAVENGVWFKASSVPGPWVVTVSVPAAIYSIPPSAPLHYVTYVKVYHSTPEVVYVAYTPGYYGTCVSHGAVVYGTGYHYSPWVGSIWYGPPMTYGGGVAVSYTPWTGWTYGFGWGWGSVTVGWGYGTYPWWGPVGWGYYYPYPYYRPPYYGGAAWGPRGAAVWGPGGWAATSGNVYSRWGSTTAMTRRSGGYNAWTGNRWGSSAGMSYNSRTGRLAAGQRGAVGNVYTGNYAAGGRGAVTSARTGTTVAGQRVTAGSARTGREVSAGRVGAVNPRTGRAGSAGYVSGERGTIARVGNDVYAGRDGNVYRPSGSSWQRSSGRGSWSNVRDQSRTQNLNRQRQARTRGQTRVNNHRSSRGSGGMRRRR